MSNDDETIVCCICGCLIAVLFIIAYAWSQASREDAPINLTTTTPSYASLEEKFINHTLHNTIKVIIESLKLNNKTL
jgi:hypothetical protein